MKQIVVLSGKGGTGKTCVSTALMFLARNECVGADCDVDAADVHLLLSPIESTTDRFLSGVIASCDVEKCTHCGRCENVCHFEALKKEREVHIDPMQCEGCGYCAHVCVSGAITLQPRDVGWVKESATRIGMPLVHASLAIGSQNSGKLVSEVKKRALRMAEELGRKYVIVDGSPGTGCPVISSLAGANYVLVVLEPTISALHDAKRLVDVVKRFRIPMGVVLNKADIHRAMAESVREYFFAQAIPVLAEIPYDLGIPRAISNGKTVPEYQPSPYVSLFEGVWGKVTQALMP